MKKLIMTFLVLSSLSFAAELSLGESFANAMMPGSLSVEETMVVVPRGKEYVVLPAGYKKNRNTKNIKNSEDIQDMEDYIYEDIEDAQDIEDYGYKYSESVIAIVPMNVSVSTVTAAYGAK